MTKITVMLQTPLRASDPRPRVELCIFREWLLSQADLPYNLIAGYTAGYPASSTRNRIAQQFLKSDAQYLIMIDDDQWPGCNPLDYIAADYDVLGFPYPSIRINADNPIPWFPAPPALSKSRP